MSTIHGSNMHEHNGSVKATTAIISIKTAIKIRVDYDPNIPQLGVEDELKFRKDSGIYIGKKIEEELNRNGNTGRWNLKKDVYCFISSEIKRGTNNDCVKIYAINGETRNFIEVFKWKEVG